MSDVIQSDVAGLLERLGEARLEVTKKKVGLNSTYTHHDMVMAEYMQEQSDLENLIKWVLTRDVTEPKEVRSAGGTDVQ